MVRSHCILAVLCTKLHSTYKIGYCDNEYIVHVDHQHGIDVILLDFGGICGASCEAAASRRNRRQKIVSFYGCHRAFWQCIDYACVTETYALFRSDINVGAFFGQRLYKALDIVSSLSYQAGRNES
jgi:hypothetical protein